MGAVFGAAFSALTVASAGGAVVGAVAGVGLSGYGIATSVQRIQADPNNECAWWDLGLSIFGFAASGYVLGNAVNNLGLPGGAAAPQGSIVNNSGSTKEVILGLWDSQSTFRRTWMELFSRGKKVFPAGLWVDENLSTVYPTAANFPRAFSEAMTNANKINFDITKLNTTRAMQDGRVFTGSNFVNYEYYQIKTNPTWLAKTTFYEWENGILRGVSVNEIELLYPLLP